MAGLRRKAGLDGCSWLVIRHRLSLKCGCLQLSVWETEQSMAGACPLTYSPGRLVLTILLLS